MKKMTTIFLSMLAALFLLASCGGDSPSKVVEKWADAMSKGDDKAAEYCTDGGKGISVLIMAGIAIEAEGNDKAADAALKKTFSELKVVDEKIDGDKATVNVKVGKETETLLKKVDGAWKLDGAKSLNED